MKKIIILLLCAVIYSFFSGKDLFGPKIQEFVVYRTPADGTEILIPEKIQIKDNGRSPAENALIHLMTVKPADDKAYGDCVPDNSRLLWLRVENGIAYVNFSKEVSKRTMGSYEATMFMGAVVNTLTEFPQIQKVQILIEGEKKITYCGVLDIEEPLARNQSLLPQGAK